LQNQIVWVEFETVTTTNYCRNPSLSKNEIDYELSDSAKKSRYESSSNPLFDLAASQQCILLLLLK